MKRLFPFIICLMGMLSLAGCAKDEVVTTGTIVGLVSDYANANRPISGATVTLNGKGLTKTTGSDGRFEFADVDPGTYTLTASADGYATDSKQVTLVANQTVNCDFQLAKASSNVEITPLTLAFGTDNDQLTFTIKNNNSTALPYTITGYPAYITVTPTSATVAGKGTQTVTVRVNRDVITKDISTSLTVNIGSDSYTVAISIGYSNLTSKITLSESVLDFGQNYKELQFAIKNVGTAGNITWTIDQPTEACLSVSPIQGTTEMGKESKVTVKLDRTKMDDNLQTFITVKAAGGSTSVQVLATKDGSQGGNTGGDDNPGGGTDPDGGENIVRNALYAYFPFNDDANDVTETALIPSVSKVSYVESFNGSKALKIPADGSFIIPEGFIDQKNTSICFWAKDLFDGHVFHVVTTGSYNTGFSLAVTDGHLKFVRDPYYSMYRWGEFSSFISSTLEGWHHIAIISADNNKKLYVDGILSDQQTENNVDVQTGIRFVMGGNLSRPNLNATTIIMDNLRVYKYRAITADEVKEIYNYEK